MAQFILKKDFSTRVSVNGEGEGDGKMTVRFKKGDIVSGEQVFGNANNGDKIAKIDTPYGKITLTFEYLTPDVGQKPQGSSTTAQNDVKNKQTNPTTDNKSIFTPKNIVIGLVVLGAVFGILKWQKVI